MVEVYHGKAGADSLGENQTGKSDAKELKAFTYLIFWLTQQYVHVLHVHTCICPGWVSSDGSYC